MLGISIIMPVYNTEKYVETAIKSILDQTFKDFELIIVNDGSTDASKDIIDKYYKIDNRIKIVNKINEGLGYARNSGLEYASGKYILFIDSDDYIESYTLEEIYIAAEKNKADITVFNMKKVMETTGQVIEEKFLKLKNETISIKNIGINKYFEEYFFPYIHGHEACNKLYKYELLKSSKVLFDSNDYICSEDLLFNIKLLPFVDKITSINKSYYSYTQRTNSLMNSGYRKKLNERFTNLINEYKNYIDKIKEVNLDKEISVLYFNLINSVLVNEGKKYGNKPSVYYKVLKETNSKYFKECMKNIAVSQKCKKLLNKYGMKNYTVVIIRYFCIISYINIKMASFVWYLYMNIVGDF